MDTHVFIIYSSSASQIMERFFKKLGAANVAICVYDAGVKGATLALGFWKRWLQGVCVCGEWERPAKGD